MDGMKAGPELDALVAERVMGWTIYSNDRKYQQGWSEHSEGTPMDIPSYSTDIAAAWEVVERVNFLDKYSRDFLLQRECIDVDPYRWVWFAWFRKDGVDENVDTSARCETAPHAICLAALKAVTQSDPAPTHPPRP
jgi:hypothetical protein